MAVETVLGGGLPKMPGFDGSALAAQAARRTTRRGFASPPQRGRDPLIPLPFLAASAAWNGIRMVFKGC